MAGWVTSMSFEASNRVGDFGTLYATDAAAAIVKINPCIIDGPNVWKENSQVQWKLTGTVKDAKLKFLLAFRYVSSELLSSACGCHTPFTAMWREAISISNACIVTGIYTLPCFLTPYCSLLWVNGGIVSSRK